eukprot:3143756-Lingulodinium_polyedra.AAC.1
MPEPGAEGASPALPPGSAIERSAAPMRWRGPSRQPGANAQADSCCVTGRKETLSALGVSRGKGKEVVQASDGPFKQRLGAAEAA